MAKNRVTRGTALLGALQLGGGTVIRKLKRYTPSLTPAAVAANTTAEQTFAVTGLTVGEVVIGINKPTAQAGLGIVGWRVSAANQLAITFSNNTAAPITPTAAETYQVLVWTP